MAISPFLALHIPDGFVNVPVGVVGWLLTIGVVWLATQQTQSSLGERQIPLVGILAAFIFAAQMINFPVAGGTSGHLLGGALAAILLGPWAAVLVMLTVIAVQALLFQDGGILALGFNVFNMGILTAFVGHTIYTWGYQWLGRTSQAQLISAGVAAWVSVQLAAAATSLELAISGTSPLNVALPAMMGVHVLIGIGEALITVGALLFIQQSRPDLVDSTKTSPAKVSTLIAVGLLIALAVAFISPLASSHPDGLERVAEDESFLHKAEDAPYTLLPDYTIPGIDDQTLTTILAGIVGVLLVAAIGFGASRLVERQPTQSL